MQTRFWASVLVFACMCSGAPQGQVALPSGGSLHYKSSGAKTRFEIRSKSGRRLTLDVLRDATVVPKAGPVKVDLVGEIPGKTLILTDSYPSMPLGMSYCQAGEERFLRVLSLADDGVRETLKTKLASCRDNIELADPGLEWDPATTTLRIRWLEGPSSKGKAEQRTIHINANGEPG